MISKALKRDLLEHTETYGLTVTSLAYSVLRRKHGGLTKPAVHQALKTLRGANRLREVPLFGSRRCFVLANRKAKHDSTCPFPEIEKIRRFAMLKVCCADGEETRYRCRTDDVRQWLRKTRDADWRTQVSQNKLFYLTGGPQPQHLGELIVDFGAAGRWDRVLGRCARLLAKYRRDPLFRCRMIKGDFELMIGTATRQKTNRLRNQLTMEPLDAYVPVYVQTLPELLAFISPSPC